MAPTEYAPSYTGSRAVLVGIDGYYHPAIPPLRSAEADATSLADLLASPPFEFEVDLLVGPKATRSSILSALDTLRTSQPNDRLLFYFAGHGHTVRDNFNNELGYILAYDTTPTEDYTAILLDELIRLRLHAPAKHIGFVLDACFSGTVLGLTRIPAIASEKFLTRRAYQVIAAGAADQPVADFHSMTGTLLEVLKEPSNHIAGLLTFSTLGLHLQQSIAADTKKTQIPQFGHLTGSQGGDFLLLPPAEAASAQPSQSTGPRPRKRRTVPRLSTGGISTAEVDLAGRLDDFRVPTAISVSAGLSHTIWMSSDEKQLFAKWLNQVRPNWGATRRSVYIFSLLLTVLLRPHILKLDEIVVDHKYLGHEALIKNTVLSTLRDEGKKLERSKIRFDRIPRSSHAKRMASMVYKGLSEPDQIVAAQDLIITTKKDADRGR